MKDHIRFERPNIEILARKGLCMDMHVHSNYSDGLNKVPFILKRAKKMGVGIALTDHNTILGCLQAKQQQEVPVILGMEVNSFDGPHMLFYFYDEQEYIHFYEKHVQPFLNKNRNARINRTLIELHEASKQYNVITSLAHPNGILWQNAIRSSQKNEDHRRIIHEVSALEAINGVQMHRSNTKAIELAEELEKSITGGSDAHTALHIGRVITHANVNTTEEFLDAIRKKKVTVIGKEPLFHARLLSQGTIIRKHAPYVRTLIQDRIPLPPILVRTFRRKQEQNR